jgi:glucose/arabinose dehydrogenase
MLFTERNGKLRILRDGRLDPEPIAGVPKVHSVRLSGLMEILPHPNFAQNQSVYLTYTKDITDRLVATTLARGRFDGRQLVDVKDILTCDSWAGDGGSGSRLAFGKDGMLYMTTGASNGNAAQEGGSLRGKILRLRDDGTPAPGNPFLH